MSQTAGLVLSGGGAFGAYEVGVIRALYNGKSPSTAGVPLDAQAFAGTSVGNFNAAVMAMNTGGPQASARRLHDLWTNEIADNDDGRGNGVYRVRGHIDNYLDLRIPGSPIEQMKRMMLDFGVFGGYAARSTERFLLSRGQFASRLANLLDVSVFLNTDPFRKLVEKSIDPDVLRNCGKALIVTATNWGTGDAQSFNFRDLDDKQTCWAAIRASAAIPGLFPPVTIQGQIYIDGGVVMNTPINPAIEEGADEIHVVSLDPSVPDLGAVYSQTTWDIMSRVITAMIAENITEEIDSARWINEGLEVLERCDKNETLDSGDIKKFIRAAGKMSRKLNTDGTQFRKLTIHRYFPKRPLGAFAGLLNFHRSAIDSMIEKGYDDACSHNCRDNGCLIPKTTATPVPATPEG
jgi:NTE family protein